MPSGIIVNTDKKCLYAGRIWHLIVVKTTYREEGD
jgi:hypothetical protein